MIKMFLPVFLWICWLLPAAKAQGDVYDQVEALAKKFPEHTEVSIGITDHGKKFFIGFKKTKGRLILVNNREQVFAIASITKLFTSLLVATLVTEKKLSMQEEIGRFYPFKVRYTGNVPPITIQSLCTHTSGLPKDAPVGLNTFLKNKIHLQYEEGKYRYSNLGYILLCDILQKVSGKKYAAFLQEKVLVPLKMPSTSIDLEGMDEKKLVKGRNASGEQLPMQTRFVYEGVGALKSSARDMLVFLEHHFDRHSPLRASLQLVQEPLYRQSEKEGMGMGWHILYDKKEVVYYHSGYLEGYTSEIKCLPRKKRGVIVLSNLSASGPYAGDIEKIAAICLRNN